MKLFPAEWAGLTPAQISSVQHGRPPAAREGGGPGAGRSRALARREFLLERAIIHFFRLSRWLAGGAFVVAGILKVADPAKFALDIGHYRLAPHRLVNLVAVLLPWIEVVTGSFVLAGVWLRASALLLASLTALFFLVIVSALARGLNIECGCFGTVGGRHVGLVNLAIDTALFALAACLAKRAKASGH